MRYNFVSETQKRAVSLVAVATLTCTETLLVSTFARALEISSNNILTNSRQELYAVGSYRCANTDGKGVSRIRLTNKKGEGNSLSVTTYGNTDNLEVSETSDEGNGKAYTAYSPNSNATTKFIEYPNGRGRYIWSLEDPNGKPNVQVDQKCFKIG